MSDEAVAEAPGFGVRLDGWVGGGERWGKAQLAACVNWMTKITSYSSLQQDVDWRLDFICTFLRVCEQNALLHLET